MIDKNVATQSETPPTIKPDAGTDLKSEQPALFTLAEDLQQLEKLNLINAVTLRLQGGRHPVIEIDELLKRRMNLDSEEFQGPYVVRLICTLMMIFLLSSVCWAILWLFATALEWNYFVRVISTGIASLFAAVSGIAIFHPASLPDEKLLKKAIASRIESLREELKVEESIAAAPDQKQEKPTDVPSVDEQPVNAFEPSVAADPGRVDVS
ncbi:MAG: hypothetical protein PHV05_00570 [Candidatus Riflebacteria bacterium]|nr:hypothetical protein [Candidatus Riflebacteria bacterium]